MNTNFLNGHKTQDEINLTIEHMYQRQVETSYLENDQETTRGAANRISKLNNCSGMRTT